MPPPHTHTHTHTHTHNLKKSKNNMGFVCPAPLHKDLRMWCVSDANHTSCQHKHLKQDASGIPQNASISTADSLNWAASRRDFLPRFIVMRGRAVLFIFQFGPDSSGLLCEPIAAAGNLRREHPSERDSTVEEPICCYNGKLSAYMTTQCTRLKNRNRLTL